MDKALIQRLAKLLFEQMERLDPAAEEGWDELGAFKQDFYITCIETLVSDSGLFEAAVALRAATTSYTGMPKGENS